MTEIPGPKFERVVISLTKRAHYQLYMIQGALGAATASETVRTALRDLATKLRAEGQLPTIPPEELPECD